MHTAVSGVARQAEDAFVRVYREVVADLSRLMPDDWSALSSHNRGWAAGAFDARQYLVESETRYRHAFRMVAAAGGAGILDAGGFFGALPLALKRLGYDAHMAERFDFYGHAFDAIADHLRESGVIVLDLDLTESGLDLSRFEASFDVVTCLAVLEHLAHTPKGLMANIRHVLRPGGAVVCEIPNIAFWPKRARFFLQGRSVLPPIDVVYHSEVPFTGHHREYTLDEARYVLRESGFAVVEEVTYNHERYHRGLWTRIKFAPALLFPKWAEIMMLRGRKDEILAGRGTPPPAAARSEA